MRSLLISLLLISVPLLLVACTSGGGSDATASSTVDTTLDQDSQVDRVESAESESAATDASDRPVPIGRTNVSSSGNRYLPGSLDLTTQPQTIASPFPAVWVLPLGNGSLIAVGEDGSAVAIDTDGVATDLSPVDPTVRPLAFRDGDSIVLSPANVGVDSDLPDATEVSSGTTRAWFDGATERVPHGALGDRIESTRLIIERRVVSDPMDDAGDPLIGNERIVVDLADDPTQSVFEGLSPLLADVDGDDTIDVLTTVSDGETGARLVVFDTSGRQIAASEPIGQRNRWRHQIAVAPTGPNGGANEVIEVETPHIGGLLQFRRFNDGDLALQYQTAEFRSHVLGSRNLDGAVVFDADNDGAPEVVVPSQDLSEIGIVDAEPAEDGIPFIDLDGGTVSSNLALGETDDGLMFAVGLSDGRLLVWRS